MTGKIFTISLKGICLAGIGLTALPSPAQADEPMNVVFLLVDDLRWNSLGCMGNPVVMTPHIDELAKDGVRFSNACVTTAICMVSRASILTGQYMSRHGISAFGKSLTQEAFLASYPAVLRKAGYWTGYVGKYGVGNFPEEEADYSTIYEGKHWYPEANGDSIQVTSRNEQDALYFLKNRQKGKPFLLSVGFFAVHAEDNHPDQYRYRLESEKYYQHTQIPAPKTSTKEHFKALPPFIGNEENEGRRRWHWRFDTPEKYQRYMKAYYRMLTEVDQAIGNIVGELKRQQVYDHTLIVFMGDNGYFQSEHELADKWYPYEESIRVPLIVHDPRLPESKRNRTVDEFVLNIDIAPMLMAATGSPIPQSVQGKDFSVLYLGKKKQEWRQEFYYEHPVVLNKKRIPSSEAYVSHRDKYIYWPDYDYEEYFNLKKDPFEEKNGISAKKCKKRIPELKERMYMLKEMIR